MELYKCSVTYVMFVFGFFHLVQCFQGLTMLYHTPKANQRKKNIEDEIQLESPQKIVDLKSDI